MRTFNITVNGTPYIVNVEEIAPSAAPKATVAAPIAPVMPAVAAPLAPTPTPTPASTASPATSCGGIKVLAPMPGTVIRHSVKDGANVRKGEVLYILESMKMENEIISTDEGKITFVVREGAMISAGETVAIIE